MGYDYGHAPLMVIEKGGALSITLNDKVYVIETATQKIDLANKFGISTVNSINVLDGKSVAIATIDGKDFFLRSE